MKINKLTDYSIILLSHFASGDNSVSSADPVRLGDRRGNQREQPLKTARQLARETKIPYPTVVKLLKNLHRKKLLRSRRGVRGGYYLVRPAHQISVREIIEAGEGPLALTVCVAAANSCMMSSVCPAQSNWNKINQHIAGTLQELKLSALASRAVRGVGLKPEKPGVSRGHRVDQKNGRFALLSRQAGGEADKIYG